jgi:hypothetical protein
MNESNYDYLKLNMKLLGFGEKQHEELEKNLKEGKESFQLKFTAYMNNKPFEANLQFRRPENSDMYFLNNYRASLERTNGDKMEHTFYLNKGKGVTAKEAYNLLEGRAVHKELSNKAGEPYKAWIQLDFENKDRNNNYEVKQFHENYGYDVKAAVGKLAVKELDGGEKEENLLKSLQKGNIQSVTVEKEQGPQKMFIEANPQYKTVNLYDGHMKRVQKEDMQQYQQVKPLNEKEVKQSAKELKEERLDGEKEGKKKAMKNQPDDESLLPKKRSRRKKGLGVS